MDLEKAVSAAIRPDAYFFDPLLLMHFNGKCYAVFGSAHQALAWQRGASAADRQYFHITDLDGRKVSLKEERFGHAYAILDIMDSANAQP